jgi:hypothetical protein
MKEEYGDLMAYLLRYKRRYATEQEFRAFVADSARTFAQDLRDFDSAISFSPDAITQGRGGKEVKSLKIGCE